MVAGAIAVAALLAAEPRVQLDSGAVLRGYSVDAVHAFEGLRYAEPPLGQLRFAPPRDLDDSGDVDATAPGVECAYAQLGILASPLPPRLYHYCLYC